jgi:hypothetical protein
MKKIILVVLGLVAFSQAFAQSRVDRNGNIILGNGRTTVRIEVGDSRDDREILSRVRRLEQAVRDLQVQVYQLQSEPRVITLNACSGDFFSVGYVFAKAESRSEAIARVMTECQRKGGGIFCKQSDVRCELIEERL